MADRFDPEKNELQVTPEEQPISLKQDPDKSLGKSMLMKVALASLMPFFRLTWRVKRGRIATAPKSSSASGS